MSTKHYVEIVRSRDGDEDEEVVRRMGPHDAHKAEKIACGAEINLNWEKFYVRVVPAGE